jgi:hypothetical protein
MVQMVWRYIISYSSSSFKSHLTLKEGFDMCWGNLLVYPLRLPHLIFRQMPEIPFWCPTTLAGCYLLGILMQKVRIKTSLNLYVRPVNLNTHKSPLVICNVSGHWQYCYPTMATLLSLPRYCFLVELVISPTIYAACAFFSVLLRH